MLVKSRERLGKTDISTPALAWISQANFRSVEILGRRGWVQASFTNKELRELLTDDEILTIVDPKDFADSLNDPSLEELSNSRLKQRSRGLFEQMLEN
ncbi:pyridine nucleotide-disulfide oxidoreductase domain-containing protein, partial [Cystoisospora suis]